MSIYVLLKQPLPGLRSTIFIFDDYVGAEEFETEVHNYFGDIAETEMGKIGDPNEMYETPDYNTLDSDVPSMFETFSTIRAAKDDLKDARLNTDLTTEPELAAAVKTAIEVIEKYGDLDENYCLIAKDALKGDLKARHELLGLIQS